MDLRRGRNIRFAIWTAQGWRHVVKAPRLGMFKKLETTLTRGYTSESISSNTRVSA